MLRPDTLVHSTGRIGKGDPRGSRKEGGYMRLKPLVVALAAIMLAVPACKSGDEEAEKSGGGGGTLTLGAALSLTGSLSREGGLTKDGYEYCKQVVNDKGGVNAGGDSYKLQIKYQDDTSEPDTAAQLVDQFNDQDVKFILGPYGSSSTEAAAAVVERTGQVMVDSAGADDEIFTQGYRNTFAVLSPASQYLASIVDAITELADPKPKTVAILSADDGFSQTAAKGGAAEAEAQGLQVVAQESFPEGATDVSAALTKVKAKNPDLILGSVHLEEGIAIMQQSEELGINPSGGFGLTVAVPTPDFVETLGKAADFTVGSTQWTPNFAGQDDVFGTAHEYATGFEQALGYAPEYHNAEASAACLTMVKAIEEAGSVDPAKVRDTLAGLSIDTFFAHIQFDETGKNADKPMSVVQIQNGKVVPVWPESDSTQPLLWPTPPFDQRS